MKRGTAMSAEFTIEEPFDDEGGAELLLDLGEPSRHPDLGKSKSELDEDAPHEYAAPVHTPRLMTPRRQMVYKIHLKPAKPPPASTGTLFRKMSRSPSGTSSFIENSGYAFTEPSGTTSGRSDGGDMRYKSGMRDRGDKGVGGNRDERNNQGDKVGRGDRDDQGDRDGRVDV